MLAVHYLRTSKNAPKLMKGEPIADAQSLKFLTWAGIGLSALLSIFESFLEVKAAQQF
jgi:hypothetical protein